MQYLITPLLEVLNPTNTVSRNRLLSFAIGNAEAEIYNCLIAKHVYYNNLGKLTEGAGSIRLLRTFILAAVMRKMRRKQLSVISSSMV